MLLIVYVDEVLIAGDSEEDIKAVKNFLHRQYTIKDLGVAKYFLRIEIARSTAGMYLSQRKYALDIVKDLGLEGANPVATPLQADLQSYAPDSPLLTDLEAYRKLVRRLLYLNFAIPDLIYVVHTLSQFMQHPTYHWDVTVHVAKYLKGASSHGLLYSTALDISLTTYCNADWAKCKDLYIPLVGPIPLLCDNESAMYMVENPVFQERSYDSFCFLLLSKMHFLPTIAS
ncbi:transmembrane signal receptor [Lithospermum erythrorhizon]|uniref:Transmembrane signal receptor n=1 Tax=Lithospermum erythrorhizon TaxID=34254 RepID=A0AAV3RY54_LITER